MTDKFEALKAAAEKIGYMQQKMATAKSFESPVLTVPIADLEIVMAALEEKDQQLSRTNSMLSESIAALKAAEAQIQNLKGEK